MNKRLEIYILSSFLKHLKPGITIKEIFTQLKAYSVTKSEHINYFLKDLNVDIYQLLGELQDFYLDWEGKFEIDLSDPPVIRDSYFEIQKGKYLFFLEDYLQINSDKKLTQNDVFQIEKRLTERIKILERKLK